MHDVGERLHDVQSRLERLVAAGWRNAAAELPALRDEADVFAELGLADFATRLRSIAAATSPTEALRAQTLALAACRMLRARLAPGDRSPDRWQPLLAPRRRRGAEPDMIQPLCRYSLAGVEVWSCLRSRGFAVEWVLVDPTDLASGDASPWLRKPLYGHLHWRARFPLGAGRDVHVDALDHPSWESTEPAAVDPHAAFRRRLAPGKLREDKLPVWGGGSVHLAPLDRAKLEGYVWLDPIVPVNLARMELGDLWALVWDQEGTPVVIAAVTEGGRLLKRLSIVHLVPGCPVEELG
jgi:hypothetical protein